MILFADGTSLALTAPTFEELEMKVFLKTHLLLEWFKTNKLKTEFEYKSNEINAICNKNSKLFTINNYVRRK